MQKIYLVYFDNTEVDSAYKERHGAELRVRELINDMLTQNRSSPFTELSLQYEEQKYNMVVKPVMLDRIMLDGIRYVILKCEDGDRYTWSIDYISLW